MNKNRRVLIVDDHRAIHADFRKVLAAVPASPSDEMARHLFGNIDSTRLDFELDSAYQGEEGAAMVRSARDDGRPYALAIVDMRMPPGWDGLQTAEKMWHADPQIQVVICTAYSDTSWEDIQGRFGSNDRLLILKKPFEPAEVRQMASALTEKWHLGRQAQLQVDELNRLVASRTEELRRAHEDLRRSSETELAKRGEALARSLTIAREIQEAVLDGILVVDQVGRVVSTNGRFVDLWRVPPEMVAAGNDDALLAYAIGQLLDPEAFLSRVRYLYEHPLDVSQEDLRLRDGRIFERWTGPVQGPSTGLLGRLWCFRDVTARRKMETDRALLTERMASMGRLAASVGHEINNPLAYVMGNVEWLESMCASLRAGTAPLSPGELAEAIDATKNGLLRIRTIVNDLQSLTRADDETRTRTNLIPILEQSLQMVGTEVRHRARVVKRFEAEAFVLGTPTRLGQAFLNLLVNAAHAIPEGAAAEHTITITCRTEEDTVSVAVSDTGAGIAEHHLERIFDPFFTTKALDVGSGLGLSICKEIVEGHGGTIRVRSRLGEGATFVVTLPRASEDAHPSAPAAPPEATTERRARVLAIDDEPLLLRVLVKRLSAHHEVVGTTSARDALERIGAGEHFDVIMCDLMMNDMTGMDFHAEIVRRHPHLAPRIVFMTGGAFSPSAKALLGTATNHVLAKPFRIAELLGVINHLVNTVTASDESIGLA